MQKDFMAMMQGQQAPAAAAKKPIPKEVQEVQSMLNDDFEKLGLPTGQDKESVKARLLKMLEDTGILEALTTPQEQQEFAMNLDKLVEDVMNNNIEGMKSNPINAMLEQVFGNPQVQGTGGPVPQGMGQPPKDFSAMMPPTPGGGMSGR